MKAFAVLSFIFTICCSVQGNQYPYQHDHDEPKEKGHFSIIDKQFVVLDKNSHIINSYGWSYSRTQPCQGEGPTLDDGKNFDSVLWYDHGMMEFITNWSHDDYTLYHYPYTVDIERHTAGEILSLILGKPWYRSQLSALLNYGFIKLSYGVNDKVYYFKDFESCYRSSPFIRASVKRFLFSLHSDPDPIDERLKKEIADPKWHTPYESMIRESIEQMKDQNPRVRRQATHNLLTQKEDAIIYINKYLGDWHLTPEQQVRLDTIKCMWFSEDDINCITMDEVEKRDKELESEDNED